MAVADLKKLRHPSETSRFLFALIVVVPLSLLALVYLVLSVGLILIPIFLVLIFIRNIVLASFLGNYVRVSEHNFPEIARWSDEVRMSIGYNKPIDVFVYEEGSFNAFLVPILKKKAVVLNSETVHGCDETEMKWILGRFVGYLKGKKMRFWVFEAFLNAFENLFVFNFFLYPYERAAVLTGDRIGAFAADFNQPRILAAMTKLMVGPDVVSHVTPQGIAEQDALLRRKPFFSLMARLFSPFPHMTRRYSEMLFFFKQSGEPLPSQAEISRRPAAQQHPAYAGGTPSAKDGRGTSISFLEEQSRRPSLGVLVLGIALGIAVYAALPYLLEGKSDGMILDPVLIWGSMLDLGAFLQDGIWQNLAVYWAMLAAGALATGLIVRQSGGVLAYSAILALWSLGFVLFSSVRSGFEFDYLWGYAQAFLIGLLFLMTASVPGYLISRLFRNG